MVDHAEGRERAQRQPGQRVGRQMRRRRRFCREAGVPPFTTTLPTRARDTTHRAHGGRQVLNGAHWCWFLEGREREESSLFFVVPTQRLSRVEPQNPASNHWLLCPHDRAHSTRFALSQYALHTPTKPSQQLLQPPPRVVAARRRRARRPPPSPPLWTPPWPPWRLAPTPTTLLPSQPPWPRWRRMLARRGWPRCRVRALTSTERLTRSP